MPEVADDDSYIDHTSELLQPETEEAIYDTSPDYTDLAQEQSMLRGSGIHDQPAESALGWREKYMTPVSSRFNVDVSCSNISREDALVIIINQKQKALCEPKNSAVYLESIGDDLRKFFTKNKIKIDGREPRPGDQVTFSVPLFVRTAEMCDTEIDSILNTSRGVEGFNTTGLTQVGIKKTTEGKQEMVSEERNASTERQKLFVGFGGRRR